MLRGWSREYIRYFPWFRAQHFLWLVSAPQKLNDYVNAYIGPFLMWTSINAFLRLFLQFLRPTVDGSAPSHISLQHPQSMPHRQHFLIRSNNTLQPSMNILSPPSCATFSPSCRGSRYPDRSQARAPSPHLKSGFGFQSGPELAAAVSFMLGLAARRVQRTCSRIGSASW